MQNWRAALNGDPLPWLLDRDTPAVRAMALQLLEDEPDDAPVVRRARAAAMRTDPIAAILRSMEPEGFWVQRGAGYGPKYSGTVWSVMFLDQMAADPRDARIQAASEYVLSHTQAPNGGFGMGARNSSVVHCLNGNLLRALIRFVGIDDERMRDAISWEAMAITGENFDGWHPWATAGPGFRCGINGGLPCAWGGIKALRGLARIPPRRRTKPVKEAIGHGAEFLLSRDPAVADYSTATTVSKNWFRFGFPSGYVADMLQNVEILCELGYARDPRLHNALDLVLSKQDSQGRWRNEYAYRGKMWADVDPPRSASKWVSLRACSVLRQALG